MSGVFSKREMFFPTGNVQRSLSGIIMAAHRWLNAPMLQSLFRPRDRWAGGSTQNKYRMIAGCAG
jgi:hypothetical protein